MPQHGGIYFYEMFLWDDNNIPASYPFTGNFFSQGEMFVLSQSLFDKKPDRVRKLHLMILCAGKNWSWQTKQATLTLFA